MAPADSTDVAAEPDAIFWRNGAVTGTRRLSRARLTRALCPYFWPLILHCRLTCPLGDIVADQSSVIPKAVLQRTLVLA